MSSLAANQLSAQSPGSCMWLLHVCSKQPRSETYRLQKAELDRTLVSEDDDGQSQKDMKAPNAIRQQKVPGNFNFTKALGRTSDLAGCLVLCCDLDRDLF